jgi:hypothetical protein
MSTEEVYIMQDTDDEWVQPTPAWVAISEAMTDETELETDDLDELETYLDIDELQTVLDTDEREELSADIEGYDVTVHENGDIDITE